MTKKSVKKLSLASLGIKCRMLYFMHKMYLSSDERVDKTNVEDPAFNFMSAVSMNVQQLACLAT